jgi:hypothetical protein
MKAKCDDNPSGCRRCEESGFRCLKTDRVTNQDIMLGEGAENHAGYFDSVQPEPPSIPASRFRVVSARRRKCRSCHCPLSLTGCPRMRTDQHPRLRWQHRQRQIIMPCGTLALASNSVSPALKDIGVSRQSFRRIAATSRSLTTCK